MRAHAAEALAWEAWRESALQACDPYESGSVPDAIERTIRAGFDSWWRRRSAGLVVGAIVEWIDANDARRRGKVYSINPEGRVHIEEPMTNRRGRRRTKIATHHFDAHETHRLRVVERPSAPAEPAPPAKGTL